MARQFSVAPSAVADIESHRAWLTQAGAGEVAHRQLTTIRAAIRELKHTPVQWPISPDHDGVRQRVVGRYAMVYEVDPDTGDNRTAGDVVLLRVFGPGQSRDDLI